MAYPEVVTRPTPVPVSPTAAPSDRLLGRRTLVTSSASVIGQNISAAFAREGAAVVPIARVPRDEAEAVRLIREVVARLGGVDLIVLVPEPADTGIAAAPLDQVLQRNIYPLFWLAKAAHDHLGAGSAIITTDVVDGIGRRASIAEAKAGIETVTTSLAQKFAADGVRVNGVAPREHAAGADEVVAAYLEAATGSMTGQMLVV